MFLVSEERLWAFKLGSRHILGEMRPSNASLCSVPNVSIFEKRDKHSCGASTIINMSIVLIVDSLLSTLHSSAKRLISQSYLVLWGQRSLSLFSSRASALVSRVSSRGFAARPLRTHALPWLNLKKKRDCSQSRPNSSHRILGVCLRESSHILNERYQLYTIFV